MFLFYFLVWICHLSFNYSRAKVSGSLTDARNKWYGPSYQPSWWNPDNVLGLRAGAFAYDGPNAPDTWANSFSECGGSQQSPINIETEYLKKRKTKEPLTWVNYNNTPRRMVLENSGHSIHTNGIWKNSSDIPYIMHGPLQKRYYFSQLHFHWGRNPSKGSEHTVNRKSFPLEMHVVHDRRPDEPTNLSQEETSDQLVVVAFMFEIVKYDNPGLKSILEGMKEVQGAGTKKTFIKPFRIDDLAETFHGDYVCYKGSLTTPPCTEGVIWIIGSKPLGISERQLNTLRKSIRNPYGNAIENFRPVQNLNGRNVYYVYC